MSELSADAKALVERTRLADEPRPEDKQRIRNRLAAELGAVAFASAAVATGSALAPAAVVKSMRMVALRWLAALAATGGLAYGALLLGTPEEQRAPLAKKVAPPTPLIEPAPQAVVEEPPTVEQPAPVVAAPQPKRSARKAPAFKPVGSSSSMSAEIALLARAQQALRAREGQQALRLAHQHAENFPNGALYEERVGIEAIAHCMLGERDHPAVRAFLARSSGSPLMARVRRECAAK
jgi:hypothetical protein